ncbi:hypothetical protein, partial [Streptococcus pneumoniae]|uniref:hypothetical protein n=1 Tax=Streptococcus pneumoniae TaxID=1313 RepID=UPI001E4E795F
SANTLVVSDRVGLTLLTCHAKSLEIRGDGWDRKRTKREPFPDGRTCKTDSLKQSRRLATLIAEKLGHPNDGSEQRA